MVKVLGHILPRTFVTGARSGFSFWSPSNSLRHSWKVPTITITRGCLIHGEHEGGYRSIVAPQSLSDYLIASASRFQKRLTLGRQDVGHSWGHLDKESCRRTIDSFGFWYLLHSVHVERKYVYKEAEDR